MFPAVPVSCGTSYMECSASTSFEAVSPTLDQAVVTGMMCKPELMSSVVDRVKHILASGAFPRTSTENDEVFYGRRRVSANGREQRPIPHKPWKVESLFLRQGGDTIPGESGRRHP